MRKRLILGGGGDDDDEEREIKIWSLKTKEEKKKKNPSLSNAQWTFTKKYFTVEYSQYTRNSALLYS